MTQRADLELIPHEDEIARPVFNTQVEADEFWERFLVLVRPELDRLAEARRSSEEEAKRRWFH